MVLFYYMRHLHRYVSEHETLKDAMRSSAHGEDDLRLSSLWIVDADGTEYDKAAIIFWNEAYEAALPPAKEPEVEPTEYREFKGQKWEVE